jgi:hypothetical protein
MKSYDIEGDAYMRENRNGEGDYYKVDEVDAEIKRLRDALDAWAEMDKESADIHPCPDYVLRNNLRLIARKLTETALAVKETK